MLSEGASDWPALDYSSSVLSRLSFDARHVGRAIEFVAVVGFGNERRKVRQLQIPIGRVIVGRDDAEVIDRKAHYFARWPVQNHASRPVNGLRTLYFSPVAHIIVAEIVIAGSLCALTCGVAAVKSKNRIVI